MKNTVLAFTLIVSSFLVFNLEGQTYDISWTDLEGVSATGNSVTKTAGAGWSNGGAASENQLGAGVDGWAETVCVETTTNRMFGLSSSNTNAHYNTIEFAIFLASDGSINVYESGTAIGTYGSYVTSDVLRIERSGTDILYKKNGATFYTSGISSSSALIADISLFNTNSTISQATASFDTGGGGGGGGGGSGGGSGSGSTVWSLKDSHAFYTDGNVVVGDSVPTGKIHIKTDTAAYDGIVINHDTPSDTTFGLRIKVPATTTKAFAISQGGSAQFQINGDGKTYAREVEVTLDPFPDYVFENDYNLMPLNQLKAFIETNKHLPNIPSGEKIDKEGIGLGELSHKQMEKIEELTLYILQMNERLEKLESENETLKEELNQLKSGKKN